MKLIVITTPQFFEGEAAAVTSLFQNGLEILHLRKPGASAEEMEYFLRQLPNGRASVSVWLVARGNEKKGEFYCIR